jgi:hypothetical protein
MNSALVPSTRYRSEVTWNRAIILAGLITTSLFMFYNWHTCWSVFRAPKQLLSVGCIFAWLTAFFVVRPLWRVLLVLVGLFIILLPGPEHYAHAESSCVGALRQMHLRVEADRTQSRQEEYPAVFTIPEVTGHAKEFFQFEYVPLRSGNGHVEGYIIQATPICRDSGPPRSFSIAEDGVVYYTNEPRAATRSDTRVQ